jgi:trigger factor
LALVEGCKHSLEITVPVEEVERETERVLLSLKDKVKISGFRPGKVPASIIQSRYASEIRQEVLESLIPRHLRTALEADGLDLVGSPDITEVKFEKGEALVFTAEFEVSPEVELAEYKNVEVPYEEPEVTEEDVDGRMAGLQEQKAEYLNVDPRPLGDGDFAVVSLKSLSGVEGAPIENDEMMLQVGDPDTLADFSANLTGMEPGQEKEIEVTYPEHYGEARLSGKTVRFHVALKAIRQKELPALNDEFAKDVGDYKDLEELREAVRSSMRGEREYQAQQGAKNALIESLIDQHDFPVPSAYIERQLDVNLEQRVRGLMAQGLDPRNLDIDWKKVRDSQRERAERDVKASMILDRIGQREAIEVTQDEVDQQVKHIASQRKEPMAAVRKELEEAEEIPRIASRIRTEKTLSFLFEQSRKVAPREKPADDTEPEEESAESE